MYGQKNCFQDCTHFSTQPRKFQINGYMSKSWINQCAPSSILLCFIKTFSTVVVLPLLLVAQGCLLPPYQEYWVSDLFIFCQKIRYRYYAFPWLVVNLSNFSLVSFCLFFNRLFFFPLLCRHSIQILYLKYFLTIIYMCQICTPSLWLVFYFIFSYTGILIVIQIYQSLQSLQFLCVRNLTSRS